MAELAIIRNGALLIKDGFIEQVNVTERVENLAEARGATVIDATGKVVMPGFVDAHTHLMFPQAHAGGPDPGAPIDVDAEARALESITAQRLAARGRSWLDAMARHGTTTLEVRTGCGPNESAEMKVLRVLRILNKRLLDIVPTFQFRATTAADAERVFGSFLFTVRKRRLARFAGIQWDTDAARRPLLSRFLEAARSLGFACRIHADQHSCGGAVSLAAEYGVAGIDHLEHATPDQARSLVAAGTVATLLPYSSLGNGRHAPARVLMDSGVAVALGSNFNPRHSPSLNMQTAIALACGQFGMNPAEALTAATINSAHALNAAHKIGSIEPGKLADVVILRAGDYRDVAYQLGTNLVEFTIKRGVVLQARDCAGDTPRGKPLER